MKTMKNGKIPKYLDLVRIILNFKIPNNPMKIFHISNQLGPLKEIYHPANNRIFKSKNIGQMISRKIRN